MIEPRKINDLELTVRTIDEIIPDMPTESLKKWKGILTTALIKIDKELTATYLHTCKICFHEEWGYRDELPVSWYKKGDAEICFQHEYDQAEKLLKEAGHDVDAFFPPEIPPVSVESLKTHMDKMETPEKHESTYDELMAML